jgi:hypothetical protein
MDRGIEACETSSPQVIVAMIRIAIINIQSVALNGHTQARGISWKAR